MKFSISVWSRLLGFAGVGGSGICFFGFAEEARWILAGLTMAVCFSGGSWIPYQALGRLRD